MILRDREPVRLSRSGVAAVACAAALVAPALTANTREPSSVADGLPPLPARAMFAAAPLPAVHAEATAAPEPAQALPPDAQALADKFARDQAEALRQADARIAQQRVDLIRQLTALQDAHARAGRLDEAVAVRDRIRQLQAQSNVSTGLNSVTIDAANGRVLTYYTIQPDPGTLTAYRGNIGETLFFNVTGSSSGPVWGTDVYTDDSRLATAAVHAGILKPGQSGVVRVTPLPGRNSYQSSLSNDVRSDDWQQWDGSYRVSDATAVQQAMSDQKVRREYANVPVQVVGELRVQRPGDPPLTYSLSPSRGWEVRGTTTQQELQRLLRSDSPETLERLLAVAAANSRIRYFENLASDSVRRLTVGASTTVELEGATDGSVWGVDVYTNDSYLPAAAVHAGILRPGERGRVRVTALPGRESYPGETRNGVTSEPWGQYGISLKLERADQ